MTNFIKTSAAFFQRDAKNVMALEIASAFSAAKRLLEIETSSCVRTNANPHIGRRHSKSAKIAAYRLGLCRTFRVGSVHTPAKARRKQQGGGASLCLRQKQSARREKLHMRLAQADWSGRTSVSNAGLKEKQKAHILTINDRLMFGGFADHVMCAGIQKSQRVAVFLSQYDFTGQQATLEATGQTFAELSAEREAA